MGVNDRLWGKRRPPRMGEQHHVDGVGDDHAGDGVIAKLWVVDSADCLIERPGLVQICDGQVDENLFGHLRLSRSVL